jgi:hypothetical protein
MVNSVTQKLVIATVTIGILLYNGFSQTEIMTGFTWQLQ